MGCSEAEGKGRDSCFNLSPARACVISITRTSCSLCLLHVASHPTWPSTPRWEPATSSSSSSPHSPPQALITRSVFFMPAPLFTSRQSVDLADLQRCSRLNRGRSKFLPLFLSPFLSPAFKHYPYLQRLTASV